MCVRPLQVGFTSRAQVEREQKEYQYLCVLQPLGPVPTNRDAARSFFVSCIHRHNTRTHISRETDTDTHTFQPRHTHTGMRVHIQAQCEH